MNDPIVEDAMPTRLTPRGGHRGKRVHKPGLPVTECFDTISMSSTHDQASIVNACGLTLDPPVETVNLDKTK